ERPRHGADPEEEPVEGAEGGAEAELARDEVDPEERVGHEAAALGAEGENEAQHREFEAWKRRTGDGERGSGGGQPPLPPGPGGNEGGGAGERRPSPGDADPGQRRDDEAADRRPQPDARIDEPTGPATLARPSADEQQARRQDHERGRGDADEDAPRQQPPEA